MLMKVIAVSSFVLKLGMNIMPLEVCRQ